MRGNGDVREGDKVYSGRGEAEGEKASGVERVDSLGKFIILASELIYAAAEES